MGAKDTAPQFLKDVVALLEKEAADVLPAAAREIIQRHLDSPRPAGEYVGGSARDLFELARFLAQKGRVEAAWQLAQLVTQHPAVVAEMNGSELVEHQNHLEKVRQQAGARLGASPSGPEPDPNAPTVSLKDLLRGQRSKL